MLQFSNIGRAFSVGKVHKEGNLACRFLFLLLLLLWWTPRVPSQVNTERFRRTLAETGFAGRLDIDATFITGNTDFQFLSSEGQFRYDWESSYIMSALGGGIGWANGERFINRTLLHLRYGHDLDTLLSLESFIQIDRNTDRKLLLRQLLGAGPRMQFSRSESLRSAIGLSYMFERERIDSVLAHPDGRVVNSHRLSFYVTFDLQLENNLRFLTVTYYQPKIDAFSDLRLLSENLFAVQLSSVVDLTLKIDVRYDSKPPGDVRDTDLASKLGISFKL